MSPVFKGFVTTSVVTLLVIASLIAGASVDALMLAPPLIAFVLLAWMMARKHQVSASQKWIGFGCLLANVTLLNSLEDVYGPIVFGSAVVPLLIGFVASMANKGKTGDG